MGSLGGFRGSNSKHHNTCSSSRVHVRHDCSFSCSSCCSSHSAHCGRMKTYTRICRRGLHFRHSCCMLLFVHQQLLRQIVQAQLPLSPMACAPVHASLPRRFERRERERWRTLWWWQWRCNFGHGFVGGDDCRCAARAGKRSGCVGPRDKSSSRVPLRRLKFQSG